MQLGALMAVSVLVSTAHADDAFRKMVEDDWRLQERVRWIEQTTKVTTPMDAAGGCDGVINGTWGFHTENEKDPWWQVDLGRPRDINRIRVWNRCDRNMHVRANRLRILLSDDGKTWRKAYQHDGKPFLGHPDKRPLVVRLETQTARFVRLQLPGKTYFHLDEVEVFGPRSDNRNLALNRPADQSSLSKWSADRRSHKPILWSKHAAQVVKQIDGLLDDLRETGQDVVLAGKRAADLRKRVAALSDEKGALAFYTEARWLQRELTFRLARATDPMGPVETILFAKRVPGSYNHMSDQYYGWWSRPGGGLFLLRGFDGGKPKTECISEAFTEPGSFLRPMISYDGQRVLFAWCKHYPKLAAEKDKLNKANVPEDAFYHLFEMRLDGSGLRQLTRGKYDDFDGRYLPDGRIVFLSTRRGQSLQLCATSPSQTQTKPDLPDCYVRCGGGPKRPVAVYTLHTMNADGSDLRGISPFEMFEWTPTVAADGTILYSRWDYVDRWNMPFMSLWAINPDGTNARIVYGNYTHAPHCTFEPRCIPDSDKIVFTASGHHAQTMGSLVLFDPTVGTEGDAPLERLTPEVPFPEIEGWAEAYFSNPWPLSERFHLVVWGHEKKIAEWQRPRVTNAMGLYLYDAALNTIELLYRDPDIACYFPIPVRPRPVPPVIAPRTHPKAQPEGRFLLVDVYQGLKTVEPGDIKALRIIAVPAKTHPTMNRPVLGLTRDDPGKCVLGTVPVEKDGSAHFRVPAGVIVFFQALDKRGMAVQTMRTATHVQPGQTLSCIGCHESRDQAPPTNRLPLAAAREPSKITVGPDGSWPLRFDKLVMPVIQRRCVSCHNPRGQNEHAAVFNLTSGDVYDRLCDVGPPSLRSHVNGRYRTGYSTEGQCAAAASFLINKLLRPGGHHGVVLDREDRERLIVWLDAYGQRLGSFSDEQERDLLNLRQRCASLLIERQRQAAMAR